VETCDNCPDQWDCYTPCKKVLKWQELNAEDRIPEGEYEPKGISPAYSKHSHNNQKKLNNKHN